MKKSILCDNIQFFYGEYENEKKTGQKIWPSPMGIWTPDFWTSSRPQFEFWGRLDQ